MSAYTVAEAADHIGATPRFVSDLCNAGHVPHMRVGRRSIRFTDAQLAALVEHVTECAPAAPVSVMAARSRRGKAS